MPHSTIDSYITTFSPEIQKKLQFLRQFFLSLAPTATESMVYGVPTFKLNGKNLVHFAAFKHHIGVYPTPEVIVQFADQLKHYKTATGSIQFPFDEDLPLELLKEMLLYKIASLSAA